MDNKLCDSVRAVATEVIEQKLCELNRSLEMAPNARAPKWAEGPLADIEAALRVLRGLDGGRPRTVTNNFYEIARQPSATVIR
jgi:hypothetical protein